MKSLLNSSLSRYPEQPPCATPQRFKAADILTPNVVTCGPDTLLSQAITLMTRNHIHRLVVVEGRDLGAWPLGVVSMTDIVRQTLGGMETVDDAEILSLFGADPI